MPLDELEQVRASLRRALNPWQTLLALLGGERPDVVQTLLGLWSVVWGACLLLGGPQIAALAPRAYAWMHGLWAWGLVGILKGLYQAGAGLARYKCRLTGDDPRAALAGCVLAAQAGTVLSVALAWGFGTALGPLNLYVAWYGCHAFLNGWVLYRTARRRGGARHGDQ